MSYPRPEPKSNTPESLIATDGFIDMLESLGVGKVDGLRLCICCNRWCEFSRGVHCFRSDIYRCEGCGELYSERAFETLDSAYEIVEAN